MASVCHLHANNDTLLVHIQRYFCSKILTLNNDYFSIDEIELHIDHLSIDEIMDSQYVTLISRRVSLDSRHTTLDFRLSIVTQVQGTPTWRVKSAKDRRMKSRTEQQVHKREDNCPNRKMTTSHHEFKRIQDKCRHTLK